MKRGEIWTAAAAGLASKPRPVLIVQDDRFSNSASLTVCLMTSDTIVLDQFRVLLEPTDANGLRAPSQIMADALMTIPRTKFGVRIGAVRAQDMTALERRLIVYLGLTE